MSIEHIFIAKTVAEGLNTACFCLGLLLMLMQKNNSTASTKIMMHVHSLGICFIFFE